MSEQNKAAPSQEPVGYAFLNTNMAEVLFRAGCGSNDPKLKPLYTTPPDAAAQIAELKAAFNCDGKSLLERIAKLEAELAKANELIKTQMLQIAEHQIKTKGKSMREGRE